MSFLHGRISFEQFDVGGRDVKLLDESHVDALARNAVGRTGALTADGLEAGFTAGDHILDLDFQLEKNIVNDALHFGFRIDSNKIPGDLMKAYTQMELAALLAQSGRDYPSRPMRLEARANAEERLNKEAKTGKFRRMKQYSALWDVRNGRLLFAGGNQDAIDRLLGAFKEAFTRNLSRATAGVFAHEYAKSVDKLRTFEDLSPTNFAGPGKSLPVAWVDDRMGIRDFLGNEFLVWLWWKLDAETDLIDLPDGSTATCMMARTLSLECPLAETGKETITSDSPVKLPEAKRALQAGKWPRKAGVVLVRHDQQYEFTLQAETFAVGAAGLPKLESAPGRPQQEDRIDQIRDLIQSIQLLYSAFLERRLSTAWRDELKEIRGWLEKDE